MQIAGTEQRRAPPPRRWEGKRRRRGLSAAALNLALPPRVVATEAGLALQPANLGAPARIVNSYSFPPRLS